MTDETIACLRISLADTEPEVWRRIDVPLAASLKMLHDIIQAAMGWEDYHLWMFEAGSDATACPIRSGRTRNSPQRKTSSLAH